MIIEASELILLNHDPIENAKKIGAIVPAVEMMLDGDSWDDRDNSWEKIAANLSELNLHFTVHPPAWDHNVAAGLYSLRKTARDLNISALNVAKIIGAKQVVFHTGYCDSGSYFNRKTAQKHSLEALYELIEIAKPEGIRVAVENVAPPQKALYTQEEFVHILDEIDKTAQYLLDLGHAHMNHWNLPWVIRQIAPRLCGVHIHDNNGEGDQHLPIGRGTIEWEKVFQEMKKVRDDCHLVLEYAPGTSLAELKDGVNLLRNQFSIE